MIYFQHKTHFHVILKKSWYSMKNIPGYGLIPFFIQALKIFENGKKYKDQIFMLLMNSLLNKYGFNIN